jgi:hypothetical protein
MRTWYGNITKPSRETILHLQDLRTLGREDTAFETPAAIREFLESHSEVEAVMFYASWMPRRAIPVARVTDALLAKLFRAPRAVRVL